MREEMENPWLNDDNTCPVCRSKKIVAHYQYPLYVTEDVRTGKEIFEDVNGKRIYNPSNRELARLYKHAQMDAQTWNYECKKCGWISEPYTS